MSRSMAIFGTSEYDVDSTDSDKNWPVIDVALYSVVNSMINFSLQRSTQESFK